MAAGTIVNDVLEFLAFTITTPQGWLNIASSNKDGSNWTQYWRAWPDDKESACQLIQGLLDAQLNVYYSAHLFSEQSTEKKYVLDSRTIFVDLDSASLGGIILPASLMLRSSDEKHQAYWLMSETLPIDELEQLSYRLTYSIPGSDHTGWWRGHMMRVPNTVNYKYSPPQRVRMLSKSKRTYDPADFDMLTPLEVSLASSFDVDDEWIANALRIPQGCANVSEVWDKYKDVVAKGTDIHMYVEGADRSECLYRLNCELLRKGAPLEEVYLLAYHSKNNKFSTLRYNGERELAKDVLRAKQAVEGGPQGLRDHINTARNLPKTPSERKQLIADMVRNQLMSHGKFIHAYGGTHWYILADEGRPIPINRSSTQLNVLLDSLFGLVASETEHMYVTSHLINHVASLPPEGNLGALSYYIPESNICLLHTGAKDVLRITEDEIDIVTNGWHGIIFPWTENATFTPNITDSQQQQHNTQQLTTNYKSKWADYLFEGALDNISADCMTAKQAIALLQAWVLTIILRNAIIARPILAVFGQQGSGKSTLFRRVMILLYGPKRQVSGITSAEDFDTQMASDPLLVVDNVDTWEKWLPDRIARAAALSETKKRKLYTDVDTVTVRSQALLGISAHNPKFGREDVTDRLILITLERVDFFKPESEMIARISGMRDELWTMIAYDIQRVLREPKPERIPQLRVEDFAALGQRVSNALGCSQDFYDAVESLVRHQKGFTLEEDSMLVDIIARFIKSPRRKSQDFMTPAKLWAEWDQMSGGGMTDRSFQKQYGNSIKLGKKLLVMMDSLRYRFVVERKFDATTKSHVYRFAEKQQQQQTEPTDTQEHQNGNETF